MITTFWVNQFERKDYMIKKKVNMKPFLKWAGGKTQLLPTIKENLPPNIDKLKIYVEPFLGAGAVFFDFISEDKFEKYVISDINYRLINVYRVIRDDADLLISNLIELKEKYLAFEIGSKDRDFMYYEIRNKFNEPTTDRIELAAHFIFLNKLGFNGLYRENKNGEYNVSTARYANPGIFIEEQIYAISKLLNKKNKNGHFVVTILNKSYEQLDEYIDEESFVYLDPPYRPITKNGFNSYDKSGFNDDSQTKLSQFYKNMSNKHAQLMLSNSDPKNLNTDDDFFDNIYSDFKIIRADARRAINSNGKGRGSVTELIITNYK